jgi:hypothetical protein
MLNVKGNDMKANRFKLLGIFAFIAIMGFTFSACGGKDYNPETDFETEPVEGGKSVRITQYIGDKLEVNIPPKIRGLPVTSIGEGAFAEKELVNVTIPNSVTEIGFAAFADNQLTSVTIGNKVSSIGVWAFKVNELTSVAIPNSVTEIGKAAFAGNKLTSVTLSNSITKIEPLTFFVNQLTSVAIPNGVTEIGNDAFAVNQLASVTIPNSVTEIGESAFAVNQLTNITIGANVSVHNTAFSYWDKYNYISIGFMEAYSHVGKAAGTYTRPDTEGDTWTKQ